MKHRISPATAISLVALFFSLTGAGFAASRYLITSASQIKPSVRHALRGAQGTPGTPGIQGPVGPQGPAGTGGIDWAGAVNVADTITLTVPGRNDGDMVVCPSGTVVLTGGFTVYHAIVTNSQDNGNPPATGWTAHAYLDPSLPENSTGTLIVWAECVPGPR